MKAHVNQEGCISCGVCITLCDTVFGFNNDGVAHAIGGDIPAGSEAAAKEARDCCPVNVIDLSS